MNEIFIIYRRTDSGIAGRIFDHLTQTLGNSKVFMDTNGIAPGEEFAAKISERLSNASVFVAVSMRARKTESRNCSSENSTWPSRRSPTGLCAPAPRRKRRSGRARKKRANSAIPSAT